MIFSASGVEMILPLTDTLRSKGEGEVMFVGEVASGWCRSAHGVKIKAGTGSVSLERGGGYRQTQILTI